MCISINGKMVLKKCRVYLIKKGMLDLFWFTDIVLGALNIFLIVWNITIVGNIVKNGCAHKRKKDSSEEETDAEAGCPKEETEEC
jgi:hypothetical protein